MAKTLTSFTIEPKILLLLGKMPTAMGIKSKSEMVEKSLLYTCKALTPELYAQYESGEIEQNSGSIEQLKDL